MFVVGRICWFSSKSGVIYTTLEMLLHACMRDGVVWFALMPLREEQQPASSGVRCCFSSLINTLSVLALSSLALTFNRHLSEGVSMQIGFYLPLSVIPSLLFIVLFVCAVCVFRAHSASFPTSCRMGDEKATKWIGVGVLQTKKKKNPN